MPVTRFGLEGYGVRRVGSFSGKTPDAGSGPHPVGVLTRFGLEGYGVRRAGAFSGKTPDTTPTPTPTPTGQSQAEGGGIPRRRRRYIFPDGTQVLATTDEALGLLERFARMRTQQEKGRPRFERIPAAELESVVGWKQASDTAEELIRPVLPSNVVFTPEKKQFAQEIARLKRKIDDEEAIFALMM